MLTLSTGDIFAILVSLGALGGVIIVALRKGATPAQIDTLATTRIEGISHDPAMLDRLERAYQQNSEVTRHAFDSFVSVMRLVAPLTPLKTDDAIAELGQKIQQPPDPSDMATKG